MNFKFTKIKTILSIILGIILTIFNPILRNVPGADPPMSRIIENLLFMNFSAQLGNILAVWVLILISSSLIYTVWSLFQKE